MEMLQDFLNDLPKWLAAITGVVTACNVITAMTPTKVDNEIIAKLLRLLNILSMNIGKNKNADDV